MANSVMHYIFAAMLAVYVLLFLVLAVWVFRSTRRFRVTASLGVYDSVRRNNRLTSGQQQLLDYLSILGHLVVVSGVLALIFDLSLLTGEAESDCLESLQAAHDGDARRAQECG
jgi:hypothetical protein